ncbi:RNA polymerase sigma factor [Jatrophihabitans sp. YIM 134969]
MDVAVAVADAHRREWGLVLAATVRVTRDLDLAEECVQDAYGEALKVWPERGIPANVGAWLTTVARRKALDTLRRAQTQDRLLPALVVEDVPEHFDVPDDRLRLIFTCCHPAIAPEARVALTLRLLCGLTTAEVARAFLVSEPTMAARITRAKKKIATARIPYRIPTAEDLPARVDTVLDVVRLVHTTGHTAPSGPALVRSDLTDRALELARLLRQLLPADPRVAALLALLLFHASRESTRVDERGDLVLLADQDRSRWNRAQIEEGTALTRESLTARPVSRFALEAAVAAVHAEAERYEDTDWAEIVALYTLLQQAAPSPVVELNRAIALGLAVDPATGLAELDRLAGEPALAGYGYLAASRADFLRRLGRVDEARTAYEEALHLVDNEVERRFLSGRLAALPAGR